MTKKIVLCLLLAVVAAALVCTAAACGGGETYTITFKDGETVLETREVAANAAIRTTPGEKQGAEFDGWYLDPGFDKEADLESGITADTVVYGKWTYATYTVTFVGADGETLKTEEVTAGAAATAPEPPVIDGREFLRWDRAFDSVYGDLVVTAIYTGYRGTASFYYGGELIYTTEAEEGEPLYGALVAARDILSERLPAYLAFSAWEADGESVDIDNLTMPADDVDIYASVALRKSLGFTDDHTGRTMIAYGTTADVTLFSALTGIAYEAVEYTLEWRLDGQTLGTETYAPESFVNGASELTSVPMIFNIADYTAPGGVGTHSDVASVTLTAAAKDSGYEGYTVTYNVPITVTEGTFTIPQIAGIEYEYNAEPHMISQAVVTGALEGDSTVFRVNDLTGEEIPLTAAGSYTVEFTVSRENYFDFTGSFAVTINRAEAVVTVEDKSVNYGDAVPTHMEYAVAGLMAEDELNADGLYFTGIPASFGRAGETYAVYAGGLKNDNYDISYASGTLTVAKRPITVRPAPSSVTYGDPLPSYYELELLSGSFAEGEDFRNLPEPEYSYINMGSNPDAGDYTVQIEFTDAAELNYAITAENGTLTVKPRLVRAIVADGTVEYGSAKPAFSFSIPELDESEYSQVIAEYDTAYTTSSPAGSELEISAALRYQAGARANYTFDVDPGTLTVTKREMTISVTAADLTYGAAVPEGFALQNVQWANSENHNNVIGTATNYTAGAGIGTYEAWAYLSGDPLDNYELIFPVAKFVVNPKALQISVTSATVRYGEHFTNPTAVVWGLVNGDSVNVACSVKNYSATSPAGVYDITATYDKNPNYTVTYKPGTLTVEKRTVTVSVNARASLEAGKNWTTKITDAANLVEGHAFHVKITLNATGAGVYTYAANADIWSFAGLQITDDGEDVSANYDVVYSISVVILSVTISHELVDEAGKEITDWEITYDGNAHTVKVNVTAAGNYTITYSASENGDYTAEPPVFTNAGTYTYYYKITYGDTVEEGQFVLTIAKKELIVTASSASVEYGSSAELEAPKAAGYIGDIPSGALTQTTAYSAGNGVGNYAVNVSIDESAFENYFENYSVTLVPGSVTVTPRTVFVSIEDVSVYYGDRAVYTVKVTSGSVYDGDILTAESDYAPGMGVGEYDISVRSNHNYNVTIKNENTPKVYVSARPVTVTVNDENVEFSAAAPEYSVTYGGMGLYGDDSLGITFACEYTLGSDAGTYVIYAEYVENANYSVTVASGTLTVSRKAISVIWNELSFTYNGSAQTNVAFCTAAGVSSAAQYTFSMNGEENSEFKNAGTYTVRVGFGSNYEVMNPARTYVIGRAEYVLPEGGIRVDGTYRHTQTLSDFADIISGYGLSWSNPGVTPAGGTNTYSAVVSDPNYLAASVEVTVTMQKAAISLQSHIVEFVYDGNAHSPVVSALYSDGSAVPSGAAAFTLSATEFVLPGTYAVTIGVSDSDQNYTMSEATLYVKIKAVDLDGVKYTLEDALYHAAAGQTITLPSVDIAFASGINAGAYAGRAYYTLKAGVTMILPSTGDFGAVGQPTYLSSGGANSDISSNASYINMRLTVPEGVTLTVNGTLVVRGALGSTTLPMQGQTGGNHSQIVNNGAINVAGGGIVDLRGFIKGTGTVSMASGSRMYSPFVVRDFRGGTNTVTVYKKASISPFNVYEMPNTKCAITFESGSELTAYFDLWANSAHNTTQADMIGTQNAVFNLSTGATLTQTPLDGGRWKITLTGTVEMGDLSLSLDAKITTVTVSLSEVFFPVPYLYDIAVGDGVRETVLTTRTQYKFLPGSTMTVAKNAEWISYGNVIFYTEFNDSLTGYASPSLKATYPAGKPAATLTADGGTVRVQSGSFAASAIIGGAEGGNVFISSGTGLTVTSVEGHSGETDSLEAISVALSGIGGEFVTAYTATVTTSFAGAGSAAAAAGSNYSFDGTKWNIV